MITFQIPGDPQLTQMVVGTQVDNQLLHMHWNSDLGVLRIRFAVDQRLFAFPFIILFPLLVCFSGNAKVPAGFGNIAELLSVLQDIEQTPDV